MSSAANILTAPMLPCPQFAPKLPSQQPQRSSSPQRKPTLSQGRALETLGHAIEYLVDSRLYETWDSPADAEAVHTLMACSRAVFADCEEVMGWQHRLQRTLMRRLHSAPSPTR
ncbi:hypothetical protein [Terriglobus sp. TAA 43]|uniref:hypothetical protein n=1 Tax=Terriglobus sp. TAA 43 TaxID=278961 RepID=UPI0006487300|nr:hypothetical protein [Terriglobus sp. TAA 43]